MLWEDYKADCDRCGKERLVKYKLVNSEGLQILHYCENCGKELIKE